jgi:hypothetical protein
VIDFDATDGARFHEILAEARAESGVLAMWLSGSRGKGRATTRSDYDLVIVVTEELLATARVRWGCHADRATDCTVMSWAQFEADAAWGAPDAWNRYSYARVRALVDRTGRAQALIDAKGRVPPGEVRAFVDANLDRYLNQTYRALKCHRDGLLAAARLEAADAVTPLLDALFALDDGRLRPYYKFLEWELELEPLQHAPFDAPELVSRCLAILAQADPADLRAMLVAVDGTFRSNGHGAVFDGWGEDLCWMKKSS